MLNIVVADPGLREYGGHHPAMIEALVNTKGYRNNFFNLKVFCHVECDIDFISKMKVLGVTTKRLFSTCFYKESYKGSAVLKSSEYITSLAVEYIKVFKQNLGEPNFVYLFHTLSWRHATALAVAISFCEKEFGEVGRCLVCLMFKSDGEGPVDQSGMSLDYSCAFKMLARQKNVRFYASEQEIKACYESTLNRKLEIHPCFLVGEGGVSLGNRNSKIIILYLGDAKFEKGFMDVPFLLKNYCRNSNFINVKFLVQYTLSSENLDLIKVDKTIKALAKLDSRIMVIDKFLPQKELNAMLVSSSAIVFNYNEIEYQYKSSGVLWMAAKYNLYMIFLTNTWLNREAKRLGVDFEIVPKGLMPRRVEAGGFEKHHQKRKIITEQNVYRAQLFKDVTSWVSSTVKTF